GAKGIRMSDDRRPTEDEGATAVAALPPVAADPEFRERLQRRFVEGDFVARRPRGRLAWIVVPLALAAGALFVAVRRLPDLRRTVLVAGAGAGEVTTDGATAPVDAIGTLAEHIRAGALVTTSPTAEVTLAVGRAWLLVVTPGSQVRLPSAAGDGGTPVRAHVEAGEIRITTGARFRGRTVQVE